MGHIQHVNVKIATNTGLCDQRLVLSTQPRTLSQCLERFEGPPRLKMFRAKGPPHFWLASPEQDMLHDALAMLAPRLFENAFPPAEERSRRQIFRSSSEAKG